MKKSIILAAFLMLSISGFSQGGLYKPSYIGWPTDTSEFGVLLMDTVTKKGAWFNLNSEDFVVEGGVVGLRVQSDSVFVMGDSLCAVTNGDTLCVFQDSVFITVDSFCLIQDGDTTCVGFSGGFGATLYSGNDTIPDDRTAYLVSTKFLRFVRVGSPNTTLLQLEKESAQNNVTIKNNNATSNKPILSLANDHATSNNFIEFENSGDIGYGFGVERTTWDDLVIFETNDIQTIGNHYMRFSGNGDSTIVGRDIQFDAGVLDSDGDYGTSGQVLSSTGTLTNWITPSSGAVRISDLDPADATNTINNDAYQQEWAWDGATSNSGLKLSSTSTGAALNTQRLFEVALSGANTTAGQSTYAAYLSNTHTNATSATNYGLMVLATSGSTNYGVYSSTSGGTTGYAGYFDGTNYGVYATGGTRAVWAETATNSAYGIYAQNTHASLGTGVYGSSSGSGGVGIWANNSAGGDPFWSRLSSTSTSVKRNGAFFNNTTGTPVNNFGGYNEYLAETSTTENTILGRLLWRWDDITHATRLGKITISAQSVASQNDVVDFYGDKRTVFKGRAEMLQGIDVASVAGAITLGSDGNTFEITGTNAITFISNVAWQNGSEVNLIFTTTATLTDGTANSGTDIGMELAGNTNFVASADDVVKLLLCEIGGVQRWREVSRTTN